MQELLSDTGLGREMHVIVGQGHLDDILNAGPEARRALIEEAAGVLKHRRRKEKALRKLEAMQANMTRLVDLTTELGRQLKPLGRQAQLARKAAVIQADLRDARLRLLADDYIALSAELARDEADETAAAALRAELEAGLMTARLAESELEAAAQQHAPRLAVAQETYFALGGLAERLRAVADLAAERHKHLSAPPEPARPGRDPDELDREAAELREQEHALSDRLGSAREQLTMSVSARTAAEAALAETERQIAADAREAAERAERAARLRGQAGAARSRLAAAQEEAGGWPRCSPRPGLAPKRPSSSTASCKITSAAGTRTEPSWWPPTSGRPRRCRRQRPGWPRSGRQSTRSVTSGPGSGPGPPRWRRRCAAVPTPRPCCWPTAAGSPACSARSPSS